MTASAQVTALDKTRAPLRTAGVGASRAVPERTTRSGFSACTLFTDRLSRSAHARQNGNRRCAIVHHGSPSSRHEYLERLPVRSRSEAEASASTSPSSATGSRLVFDAYFGKSPLQRLQVTPHTQRAEHPRKTSDRNPARQLHARRMRTESLPHPAVRASQPFRIEPV